VTELRINLAKLFFGKTVPEMKKLFFVASVLLIVFGSNAVAIAVMLQRNRTLISRSESFSLFLMGAGFLGLSAVTNRRTFFANCVSKMAKSRKTGATRAPGRAIVQSPSHLP
jgi:hypothetical protein